MTNSSLGPEGGAALAKVVSSCGALAVLRLEDCELQEDGCGSRRSVVSASALREVDLRYNEMEAGSAKTLAGSLASKTQAAVRSSG